MNMDELFKRIIQIETNAQDLVNESKIKHEKIDEDIEQAVEKIKIELNEKCEQRVKKIEDTEKELERVSVEKILKENEQKLESINKIYSENKDKWVNDIFERVIG